MRPYTSDVGNEFMIDSEIEMRLVSVSHLLTVNALFPILDALFHISKLENRCVVSRWSTVAEWEGHR